MIRTPSAPAALLIRHGFPAFLVAIVTFGCAASRENGANATAQSSGDAKPAMAAPAAEEQQKEAEQHGQEAAAKGDSMAEGPTANSQPGSPPSTHQQLPAREASPKKSGAAAAPAPRARAGKSSETRAQMADDADRARPAFAEPPELQRALAEFESQLTTLSTTKSCSEACKALDSMRRSAQQICTLVLEEDPRHRCPTAKERLERALRDLNARCPSCD